MSQRSDGSGRADSAPAHVRTGPRSRWLLMIPALARCLQQARAGN
jgi:hypothetical protein